MRNSANPWTVAYRLLCPWNSPGKDTEVGSHSLFQLCNLTDGWTYVHMTLEEARKEL